jgi:hypothetical protein
MPDLHNWSTSLKIPYDGGDHATNGHRPRDRYIHEPATCTCGHEYGSRDTLYDLLHRGIAHLNFADHLSRPGPATMALIKSMVVDNKELEDLLAQPPTEYIRLIVQYVRKWKRILADCTERLVDQGPGIAAIGQPTHGSSRTLRWTLHVSSGQHPELHRAGEAAGHVNMRNHPQQRTAVLGIIMAQAMARGDKSMWVNEVELMWCSKHAKRQRYHVDGAVEGVLALLVPLRGGSNQSTSHPRCCGAN